jgi:hypothetical protein
MGLEKAGKLGDEHYTAMCNKVGRKGGGGDGSKLTRSCCMTKAVFFLFKQSKAQISATRSFQTKRDLFVVAFCT